MQLYSDVYIIIYLFHKVRGLRVWPSFVVVVAVIHNQWLVCFISDPETGRGRRGGGLGCGDWWGGGGRCSETDLTPLNSYVKLPNSQKKARGSCASSKI